VFVDGVCAEVLDKYESEHHELPAHEIAIEVVSLVDHRHDLISGGMGLFVKIGVYGGKTDERSLASLHVGQPHDGQPEDEEGDDGVRVIGDAGVAVKDDADHNDGAEYQEAC